MSLQTVDWVTQIDLESKTDAEIVRLRYLEIAKYLGNEAKGLAIAPLMALREQVAQKRAELDGHDGFRGFEGMAGIEEEKVTATVEVTDVNGVKVQAPGVNGVKVQAPGVNGVEEKEELKQNDKDIQEERGATHQIKQENKDQYPVHGLAEPDVHVSVSSATTITTTRHTQDKVLADALVHLDMSKCKEEEPKPQDQDLNIKIKISQDEEPHFDPESDAYFSLENTPRGSVASLPVSPRSMPSSPRAESGEQDAGQGLPLDFRGLV